MGTTCSTIGLLRVAHKQLNLIQGFATDAKPKYSSKATPAQKGVFSGTSSPNPIDTLFLALCYETKIMPRMIAVIACRWTLSNGGVKLAFQCFHRETKHLPAALLATATHLTKHLQVPRIECGIPAGNTELAEALFQACFDPQLSGGWDSLPGHRAPLASASTAVFDCGYRYYTYNPPLVHTS